MTPAAPRRMGHPASHAAICTAALWSRCRCPKCNPEHPARPSPAQGTAAARTYDPAGGGTPPPSNGAGADASLDPAADRSHFPGHPIGGLSVEEPKTWKTS